jgi:ParB family chromosome partitioning protein
LVVAGVSPTFPALRSGAGRVIPLPRDQSLLIHPCSRRGPEVDGEPIAFGSIQNKGNSIMTIQTVKFSQLRLSPLNVRRAKPSAIESMADDIAAHGLIQNLATYEEDGVYHVFAGGRRFRALELLKKRKSITGTYPVAIVVRTKDEAVELSLAENAQREDMHPADAVRAYAALRDQGGLSAVDIAVRFGYSEAHVKRLLSLGSLAPVLLDEMGEDRLSIETARALTITSDPAQQVELFNRHGDNAHRIRQALTIEKVATDCGTFVFVGREAYEAAGGTITADLFGKDGSGYADDPELLEQLAEAKMAQIGADLRDMGWKSVEASTARPDDIYCRPMLHPVKREATEAEAAEIEQLSAQIDEITEADPDSEELAELHDRLDALENALLSYPSDLRAQHGVVAYIDYRGALDVRYIRLRSDDDSDRSDRPKAADGPYSKALIEQLSGIRTLALQQAVASDPTLALDILLDTMAAQLLHGAYSYRLAASVSSIRHAPEVDDELMGGSSIVRVETAMAQQFAAVPDEGRFAAIRNMDPAEKMQLLAGLVAITIDAIQHNGDGDETRLRTADLYAGAAGLNIADVWTPGCEVFTRMKKGALLAILTDACGPNAAENCAKMKRNDLAVAVAERLPAGWMPTPVNPLPSVPEQPDDEGEMSKVA